MRGRPPFDNSPYPSSSTHNKPKTSRITPNLFLSNSVHNKPKISKITHSPRLKSVQSQPKHQFSAEDIKRKKIADENKQFVIKHPNLLSTATKTVKKVDHENYNQNLPSHPHKAGQIFINNNSSIYTAIDCHKRGYDLIYVLNFADALKPGGGYLNGRGAQEETLCRQTLLYPTLQSQKEMYSINAGKGPEASDVMILSQDVLVIRDDFYNLLKPSERFHVDIISSPAVNNSHGVHQVSAIMLRRIRKIVTIAAYHASQQKKKKVALILGAFGCGVFKNNAEDVSKAFATVLKDEGMQGYFDCVVFPIYKDKSGMTQKFRKNLL